jgi:hypothetical protein
MGCVSSRTFSATPAGTRYLLVTLPTPHAPRSGAAPQARSPQARFDSGPLATPAEVTETGEKPLGQRRVPTVDLSVRTTFRRHVLLAIASAAERHICDTRTTLRLLILGQDRLLTKRRSLSAYASGTAWPASPGMATSNP